MEAVNHTVPDGRMGRPATELHQAYIPKPALQDGQLGGGEEVERGTYDQDILMQEIERITISSSPVRR